MNKVLYMLGDHLIKRCKSRMTTIGNQRWRPVAGSEYNITYVSACKHDGNEIPTAMTMRSESGNITRQMRILSDVRMKIKDGGL